MSLTLVVSHDAGGAEVISSWVRKHPKNTYLFVLDGPAVPIFTRKLGRPENYPYKKLDELVQKSNFVLTGTGWASNLEKMAIRLAKDRQVKSASFLDHWCNYRERFDLDGEQVLPDELWVGDAYAMELAREIFCGTPVRLIENPYLMDIRDEIDLLSEKHEKRDGGDGGNGCIHILYICEPVSPHALIKSGRDDAFGYTEFEAMDLFVSHLHALVEPVGKIQVRLRPHPSEPPEKYARYTGKESGQLEIMISQGNTLVDDCAWSDLVVGMNSMALVVALAAGKKVFCCIPGHSRPVGLPHEGIRNFLEWKAMNP